MANGSINVDLDLTKDERTALRHGLSEWGGPARMTDRWANALGYRDRADFDESRHRLTRLLETTSSMTKADWMRLIQALELAFVSDAVGSGLDWQSTTPFDDATTIELLRALQRKWRRS